MFNLYSNDEGVLYYRGYPLVLSLYFDNVLAVIDLMEESFSDFEKLVLAFQILVFDADSYVGIFDIDDIANIVSNILNDTLGAGNGEVTDEVPAYDFNYDAERIYSSFLQEYGINLKEQQGVMKWAEFIALFHNLSEDTPIMRDIYYRTCELPKGKENAELRKDILTKRKIYELPQAKRARQMKEIEMLCREAELI